MKTTILIAEDDFIIATDIRAILEEQGYSVVGNLNCVEEAVTFIEKTPPNLVLIDINLKKAKDGINLGNYLLKKGGIWHVYVITTTIFLAASRALSQILSSSQYITTTL